LSSHTGSLEVTKATLCQVAIACVEKGLNREPPFSEVSDVSTSTPSCLPYDPSFLHEIKQEPETRNISNKTQRLSKTEQKYFIIPKNE
uniref:Uncharacterized protein n=1 Tax=Astatotilapia calliptera TaxID=8154 RepID=A0AAX7V6Y5_ASTCA